MSTYEVKPSLWINNMNHCKKYFCACQCIYDLLGMSHMNTTYKHMYPQHPHPQQTRNNTYHTISSQPEVVHHHSPISHIYSENPIYYNMMDTDTDTDTQYIMEENLHGPDVPRSTGTNDKVGETVLTQSALTPSLTPTTSTNRVSMNPEHTTGRKGDVYQDNEYDAQTITPKNERDMWHIL